MTKASDDTDQGASENPQPQEQVGGKQVDNLLEASVPYKFEKSGIYLIEVKSSSIDLQTVARFQDYFREYYDIRLHFILTEGQEFALQAVPAVRFEMSSTNNPQSQPTIDSEVEELLVAHNRYIDNVWRGLSDLDNPPQTAQAITNLIAQAANKAALKAVREDRLANAEFWKDKIDRMFDGEIATYKNALTADKEQADG